MAHGLNIWNASGVLTLSVADRITRHISDPTFSQYHITSFESDTFDILVSVPGMAADGSWFVCGKPYMVNNQQEFFIQYFIEAGQIRIHVTQYTHYLNGSQGWGTVSGEVSVFRC